MVKVMRDDLHVLSGSYVLDALSEPERDSFERHLQHCPLCEAEVRGLRETAARLGLAKTFDPPPQMLPRVLAAAYRTRQLPPPADEQIGLEHRRVRVTLAIRRAPARCPARRAGSAAGPAAGRRARRRLPGDRRRPRHHPGLDQAPARRRPDRQRRDQPGRHGARRADARSMRTSVGGTVTVVRLRGTAGRRRVRHGNAAAALRGDLPAVGDRPGRRPLGRAARPGPAGPARCWPRASCPATGSGSPSSRPAGPPSRPPPPSSRCPCSQRGLPGGQPLAQTARAARPGGSQPGCWPPRSDCSRRRPPAPSLRCTDHCDALWSA